MTVSDENLKKIETPFNLTTVNRSETFFDCANKKIEKVNIEFFVFFFLRVHVKCII